MKRTIINLGFGLGFMLGLSADGFAQMSDYDLLSDLSEGWEKVWIERKLGAVKPTKYEVKVENDTNQVLKATSIESASALWRMVDIRPGSVGKISWRWKVERTLSDKTREKTPVRTQTSRLPRVLVRIANKFVTPLIVRIVKRRKASSRV